MARIIVVCATKARDGSRQVARVSASAAGRGLQQPPRVRCRLAYPDDTLVALGIRRTTGDAARMNLAPSIWVISDGAAGNELQALALAGALSSEPARIWRVRARWPYSALVPQFAPVLTPDQWQPPLRDNAWPDIAIGAGRIGAAALLSVQRASGGRTRVVQIMNPRIDPERFDVVITPAHDQLRGANVIAVDGSLHAIDAHWLARERIAHVALGRLSSPRTVVLIGGRRRGVRIDRPTLLRLAETLAQWRLREGGSVLLLGSRRTPPSWIRRLRRRLSNAELVWFGPEDGNNPYRGAIAWGDRFIVSADSVNMQSEALATGRPVYSLSADAPLGKLGRFHRAMVGSGRLRPLQADPVRWNYAPLRELERITPLIRARLGLA